MHETEADPAAAALAVVLAQVKPAGTGTDSDSESVSGAPTEPALEDGDVDELSVNGKADGGSDAIAFGEDGETPLGLPPGPESSDVEMHDAGGALAVNGGVDERGRAENKRGLTYEQQILEKWEGPEFRRMAENYQAVAIVKDAQDMNPSLSKELEEFQKRIRERVEELWTQPLPQDHAWNGLLAVAFYLQSTTGWDRSNDLVVVELLGLLSQNMLRSHPDAVAAYDNGAFKKVEQIPTGMIRRVATALTWTQNYFCHLQDGNVEQSETAVLQALEGFVLGSVRPVQPTRFKKIHWAGDAGLSTIGLANRFTSMGKTNSVLDNFGNAFVHDRPERVHVVSFDDAALQFVDSEDPKKRVKQIDKSPQNNCYTHVPAQLKYKPKQENVDRMRVVLAATFAGNEDARIIDMSMEALAIHNAAIPQELVVERDPGGGGKSTRSILRANVLRDGHKFVPPVVLCDGEEFQKQGVHFAHAVAATMQECKGGMPLQEDISKAWIGNQKLGCRPNFGVKPRLGDVC